MVRTKFMIKNIAIRSLGPHCNRHNYINEGFSPIGEISYLVVYLFGPLLHWEHFYELYHRELIAFLLWLVRSTPVVLFCAFFHPSDLSVYVGQAQCHGVNNWRSSHWSHGQKSNVSKYSSVIDERSASLSINRSWIWAIPSCHRKENQAQRWPGKWEVNPNHIARLHPASGQRGDLC
jgi:hypothetical protein